VDKEFRTIAFLIPATLSAAVDASEMAADFLSRVDWLAKDLSSIGTEVRRGILQAVRGSLRDGQRQVTVRIDVFPEDCVIRISQQRSSAKQHTIHLRRDFAKSPKSDEEFLVDREVCVS
jgi:hypothetical protein